MQYWSLTVRLESAMKQLDSARTEVKIKVISIIGLLVNLSTGCLLITAYYELTSRKFENWVEAINVAPSFISVFFFGGCDAQIKVNCKKQVFDRHMVVCLAHGLLHLTSGKRITTRS